MQFKKLTIAAIVVAVGASTLAAHPSSAAGNPYGAAPSIDPAGPNDPLLTMKNGTKVAKFTFSQLKGLKIQSVSIYEPFIKQRQSFTCVPLSTLFAKVGIKGNQKVSTLALNDYMYNNTASGFTSSQGCLAITRNGSAIPYDQGGPIRLIYPDKSKWAKVLNAWNWSLASITAIS